MFKILVIFSISSWINVAQTIWCHLQSVNLDQYKCIFSKKKRAKQCLNQQKYAKLNDILDNISFFFLLFHSRCFILNTHIHIEPRRECGN